jgi:hypothetical protein
LIAAERASASAVWIGGVWLVGKRLGLFVLLLGDDQAACGSEA